MPRAPSKCLRNGCLDKAVFRGYCNSHQQPRQAWVKTEESPDRSYLKTRAWKAQRVRVLDRDKWICQFKFPDCQVRATQVDHRVPVWYSGRDKATDLELAAICESCHGKKSSAEGLAAKRFKEMGKKNFA